MKLFRWAALVMLLTPAVLMGLSARPVDSATRIGVEAQTRHPIVLVHGMTGFDQLGSVSYWRGIPERLQAHGATVWVMQVSAFHSSEVRGQQLLVALEARMKAEGVSKVHLIGHSHGSHTSRYVAGLRPDLVASVTSVAGPNHGSAVADWLTEAEREHPGWVAALMSVGDGLGRFVNWASDADWPQDTRQAMRSLTSEGAADFNRRFPAGVPAEPCGQGDAEVNGVAYYSWSGVGAFYRAVNPTDYLMAGTATMFPEGARSDGLVERCSSHLGQVIRDDYPMNHFHAVNQVLGLVSPDIDPVELYLDHAKRLKAAGL